MLTERIKTQGLKMALSILDDQIEEMQPKDGTSFPILDGLKYAAVVLGQKRQKLLAKNDKRQEETNEREVS